jgi:hypothetical protein
MHTSQLSLIRSRFYRDTWTCVITFFFNVYAFTHFQLVSQVHYIVCIQLNFHSKSDWVTAWHPSYFWQRDVWAPNTMITYLFVCHICVELHFSFDTKLFFLLTLANDISMTFTRTLVGIPVAVSSIFDFWHLTRYIKDLVNLLLSFTLILSSYVYGYTKIGQAVLLTHYITVGMLYWYRMLPYFSESSRVLAPYTRTLRNIWYKHTYSHLLTSTVCCVLWWHSFGASWFCSHPYCSV